MDDLYNLQSVLFWLATGPGAVYVAGRAVSLILEQVPGWGMKVGATAKRLIVLAAALLLMLGSNLLLAQPVAVERLSPYYRMAFTLIAAWLGTQHEYRAQVVSGTAQSRFH